MMNTIHDICIAALNDGFTPSDICDAVTKATNEWEAKKMEKAVVDAAVLALNDYLCYFDYDVEVDADDIKHLANSLTLAVELEDMIEHMFG